MENLRIDPEFRDKIPPLTEAEFEQLQENILSDGEVYEPIAVWNGTIVDGHNRWRIIQEHPGLPYRLKQMHFPDKWSAFEWMYKKQLGRRNLTEAQRTVLIGKMHDARKMHDGEQITRNESGRFDRRHENQADGGRGRTRDKIAAELGISPSKVDDAVAFTKGVDALREISPEAAEKGMAGNSGATKTTIQRFPKIDPVRQKTIADQIASGSEVTNITRREKIEPDKPKKEPPSEYAETRRTFAKIEEVSGIISSNRGNAYTIDDAIAEMKVIEREFLDKARRVLQIRRDVINGDKRMLKLIYQFADDIEELKEELTNENPETSV